MNLSCARLAYPVLALRQTYAEVTTLFHFRPAPMEADRPDIADQFLRFLEIRSAHMPTPSTFWAICLNRWVGDDDPNEHYAWIKQGLKKLTRTSVPVFFMHGNRDFMIGEAFASETGIQILPDPTVIDLYSRRVLLSHGDAYCTDDTEYQAVRAMTRNTEWQQMMLGKSLQERLAFAAQARAASQAHGGNIDDDISDVSDTAIEQALLEHGTQVMLHGHTHRPAIHEFECNGSTATRIVLGDWYEQGSVVRWTADGPSLDVMER